MVWKAALADAGIAESSTRLVKFPAGSDLGQGRQAIYQAPGSSIWPEATQRFLEVLNEDPDLHRIGLADDASPLLGAALIRHELEHARQFEHHGSGVFKLQDLIGGACWDKTGRSPVGGGFLVNVIPPELDANAAAARFAWSRDADGVAAYLSGPDPGHQVLFRYQQGPEPVETLVVRTIAFALTLGDQCETTARTRTGSSFAEFAVRHCPGAGNLWVQLRGGQDPDEGNV